MLTYKIAEDELSVAAALVEELAGSVRSVEDQDFVDRGARLASAQLPDGLRAAIQDYRLGESDALMLISGWPVVDDELPATPAQPRAADMTTGTLSHDLFFYLVAEQLGDPVAWSTQQDGKMMHDIFPVAGKDKEQIGWSSDTVLTWHTEDAYHTCRADYLGLMCLRNPTEVGTTYADVRDLAISEKPWRHPLFREEFTFFADAAHQTHGNTSSARGAVLFGDVSDPYLRLDPEYMEPPAQEDERNAIAELSQAINANLRKAALHPGDILLVDNFRAVHGRERFQARFDGTDRWLRRLNITRDLRRSRHLRATASSRVIGA